MLINLISERPTNIAGPAMSAKKVLRKRARRPSQSGARHHIILDVYKSEEQLLQGFTLGSDHLHFDYSASLSSSLIRSFGADVQQQYLRIGDDKRYETMRSYNRTSKSVIALSFSETVAVPLPTLIEPRLDRSTCCNVAGVFPTSFELSEASGVYSNVTILSLFIPRRLSVVKLTLHAIATPMSVNTLGATIRPALVIKLVS